MAVSIIFLLILVPLIFGIPILVAVYVYRDANRRGMNAVLWMLVALLTPSLLGLIIYLLVRNNYSDLTCPNCNTPVEESYVVCPNCRTKLCPTCEVCSAPVQMSWKVCPHCGSELPQYSMDVATPVRKKDNTLGKILIAILVIPIAIILLLILFAVPLSYSTKSGGYSTSLTPVTMSEFMSNCTEAEAANYKKWFDEHASAVNGQTYHIYTYETEPSDGNYVNQYLIYIPGAIGYHDFSHHIETKGFLIKRDYLVFDFVYDGKYVEEFEDQLLFIFTYEGDITPPERFIINFNGNEHEITPDGYSEQPFLPYKLEKPEEINMY